MSVHDVWPGYLSSAMTTNRHSSSSTRSCHRTAGTVDGLTADRRACRAGRAGREVREHREVRADRGSERSVVVRLVSVEFLSGEAGREAESLSGRAVQKSGRSDRSSSVGPRPAVTC